MEEKQQPHAPFQAPSGWARGVPAARSTPHAGLRPPSRLHRLGRDPGPGRTPTPGRTPSPSSVPTPVPAHHVASVAAATHPRPAEPRLPLQLGVTLQGAREAAWARSRLRGLRTLAPGATLSARASTRPSEEERAQEMTLGSRGTRPTQRRHDGSRPLTFNLSASARVTGGAAKAPPPRRKALRPAGVVWPAHARGAARALGLPGL